MIEDKLRQAACARILHAIDEPEVLGCRDGYRLGCVAGEAVRDLTFDRPYGRYGYVVEADIKGCFDHMDHDWRLKRRGWRIDDRALLGLIRTWLNAGMLETDGRVIHPDTGPPRAGWSLRCWPRCIDMMPWTYGLKRSSNPGAEARR